MKLTPRLLAWRSFLHYAKSHLGLLTGAFLSSAILSGSLVVGDSVRASLKMAALQRLGKIDTALVGGDRWFREDLKMDASDASIILLRGAVSVGSGDIRANAVQVLGVDDRFWQFSLRGSDIHLAENEIGINESLSLRLGVKVGDTVVIRVEAPSAISRDAPLSGDTNQELTLRRKVGIIVSAESLGNFQLSASQVAPDNVFVPLKDLQIAVEKPSLVNVLLHKNSETADSNHPSDLSAILQQKAQLEDYALQLQRVVGDQEMWEIRTERVFLDESVATQLLKGLPNSEGVLTYLVNGLNSSKSENRTPYSMVTATVFSNQDENSATITQWLADDLNLSVGDDFSIRYFTVGLGRELKEESATFKVSSILPMNHPIVNRDWTPNFPGVSDVDNCRDWTPGIPVKLDAIRDKDEEYWDQYRGTPKAFIGLSKGQQLWGNRFGNLTSVRFPDDGKNEVELKKQLAELLKLSDIGLAPISVRSHAMAAAQGSVDFGGLFLGLSMFLIAAALVFSCLLFLFTLEQRVSQVGLLLAIGWKPAKVRSSILWEAGMVAVIGSALGLLGGMLYTRLALAGLNGVWSGATVGLHLVYQTSVTTLIIAFVASVLASIGTLWWSTRRMFHTSANALLNQTWLSNDDSEKPSGKVAWNAITKWFPVGCLFMAAGLSWMGAQSSKPQEMAGLFFGAGFVLLAGGLIAIRRKLKLRPAQFAQNIRAIGIRNICRRPGRSLAVIGMMAGGIFLVVAVNAFRLGNSKQDDFKRHSGTGGFALIGESSMPIYDDLNKEAAWEEFALDEKMMADVKVVPFRVREGDDASCLNLNRAQKPVLTAVNPQAMVDRQAFVFVKGSWEELQPKSPEQCSGHSRSAVMIEDAIPAIADQATALWGLGKGIGDTLEYTDASGKNFQVKLVGLLAGSVLQGKIIINETDYLKKFPDAAGYQFFLIDVAHKDQMERVQSHLTRQLEARGLALQATEQRLAAFNAVQDTYIGIFTVLGGLGVLLGSAGLGVLAMRNVLERRGEFGLMQAVGFRNSVLRTMVFGEHVALLVLGLILGLISAALAIWPNVFQSGKELPLTVLTALIIGILVFGLIVCRVAASLALKGELLDALRKE